MSVLLKTTGVTQMLFVLTLLVATTVPVTMASQEMASVAVSVNILQCELTKPTCQFGSSLHACSEVFSLYLHHAFMPSVSWGTNGERVVVKIKE